MLGRSDDVEVGGAVAGRIAAEEDFGAVKLEGVEKSVEDFRWHEVPRHEHVCPFEQLRRRLHRRRKPKRHNSLPASPIL